MQYKIQIIFLFMSISGFARPFLPMSISPDISEDSIEHKRFCDECLESMRYFNQYTFGLEAIVDEQEKLEWILENKNSQIKNIENRKIYLSPQSIVRSEFGDFLTVEGCIVVRLTNLFTDEQGSYIFQH